jgi:hypothetical protein
MASPSTAMLTDRRQQNLRTDNWFYMRLYPIRQPPYQETLHLKQVFRRAAVIQPSQAEPLTRLV